MAQSVNDEQRYGDVQLAEPDTITPYHSMEWLPASLKGFPHWITPLLHRHPLTEGPYDGVLRAIPRHEHLFF